MAWEIAQEGVICERGDRVNCRMKRKIVRLVLKNWIIGTQRTARNKCSVGSTGPLGIKVDISLPWAVACLQSCSQGQGLL